MIRNALLFPEVSRRIARKWITGGSINYGLTVDATLLQIMIDKPTFTPHSNRCGACISLGRGVRRSVQFLHNSIAIYLLTHFKKCLEVEQVRMIFVIAVLHSFSVRM